MIFSLIADFADALASMPREHPRYRILKLLDEAIRRDVHFIDRHPTTFFQCMWNTCWWYDCPEAAGHYLESEEGWSAILPWALPGEKLCNVLQEWRNQKECAFDFSWIRSLRPPDVHLGTALQAILPAAQCAVFTPDGRRIVSGMGNVCVSDAVTGKELFSFPGTSVSAVAISPDGRKVAAADYHTLKVWQLDTGAELCHMETGLDLINCVALRAVPNQISV